MENSIKDIINNSLDQVRSVVDANTIIGQAIQTDSGTLIIPVSKISVGMATGGLDLPSKGEGNVKNFGGGGGTGVTVTPIGFLTVYPNGGVEMLHIGPSQTTPIEQIADIIDRTPDLIARVKAIFAPLTEKDTEIRKEEIVEAAAAAQAELARDIEEEAAEETPLTKKELRQREKLAKKAAKQAAKEAKKNKKA